MKSKDHSEEFKTRLHSYRAIVGFVYPSQSSADSKVQAFEYAQHTRDDTSLFNQLHVKLRQTAMELFSYHSIDVLLKGVDEDPRKQSEPKATLMNRLYKSSQSAQILVQSGNVLKTSHPQHYNKHLNLIAQSIDSYVLGQTQ